MTSTTPAIPRTELAAAVSTVAQILQARVKEFGIYAEGRALLDRRVLLQVAAGLPPTADFDRHAWEGAWRASRTDGTRAHRKALYEQLCETLAAEFEDEDGRWEGRREPAEILRVAHRLHSIETRICIDDTLGPYDCRVDPTNRWNGWLSPYFTLDTSRELATRTQEIADEYGFDCTDTIHVIDGRADSADSVHVIDGGTDSEHEPQAVVVRIRWNQLDEGLEAAVSSELVIGPTPKAIEPGGEGEPRAVVLHIRWMYMDHNEEGEEAAQVIQPNAEGLYGIGGWEWTWHFATWSCLCGSYEDWHETECPCGLTRDGQPSTPLEAATWKVGRILRTLAPEATSALIDIHEGCPHVISVYAGDTEIDSADDGVYDTETLGAADEALRQALDEITAIGPAAAGWEHVPDECSAHVYRLTFPS
ncbi:hypothetical protein OG272_15920 [Streptomyces sp. NBC_00104]|uniref:hypothetical protein n=1 Tax=Streptomyces sp. NBC_00104 TaxID=2903621 RepID=UPI0032516DC7